MNKKGFTLIELIVSITLVSIILVSLFSNISKTKSKHMK
ncbi:MAG: type II secretion system GspH family protein [Clostridium sp.]|nr:MAG: type II secretion system GspH family protein [Clostridium sp.]